MGEEDLPEHVRRNRTEWDTWATRFAEWAPRAWAASEPAWGIFSVPDAQLRALPTSAEGLDVVELGCGTAYFSAWLARRGARPVGLDNSPAQLETARRMQEQFDLTFPSTSATPKRLPSLTPALTLGSANTAPRSGAIPTAGSPRQPAFCGPAASSSFSSTAP